ncbi:transposase [Mycobacterium avium]|uniref:transposase n=1 Tax=Mycobacterium avium TaxID=1764 RepID=UPI00324E6F33
MRRTRRSFTPEYRFTAAHRVIDGKERVVDVARELNLNDSVLHTWVRDERWRMSADSAGGLQGDPSGGPSPKIHETRDTLAQAVRCGCALSSRSRLQCGWPSAPWGAGWCISLLSRLTHRTPS